MSLTRKIVIIIIMLSVDVLLLAHPHLFAGVDLSFDITKENTLIITQQWMFDDLTSMIILEDFDTNCDDVISPSELKELKESVIPGLKEENFYTDLEVNGQKIKVKEASNFTVGTQDIYVYYKFDIVQPLTGNDVNLEIKTNVYDRDFYTKFFINSSSGLKVSKPKNMTHKFEVYENKGKSYYFGQFNPLEVKLILTKD